MQVADSQVITEKGKNLSGPVVKTAFSPEVWEETFRGNEFLRGLGMDNIKNLNSTGSFNWQDTSAIGKLQDELV